MEAWGWRGRYVYLINVALWGRRVRFAGIAQTVFYVCGVFLLCNAFIQVLIRVLIYLQVGSSGDLDVIETEFQKCLSDSSWVYYLMTGSPQKFDHDDFTGAANTLTLINDIYPYVLFLPFAFLIAKLLATRYATPLWINAVLAVGVYTAVMIAHDKATGAIGQKVVQDSHCDQKIVPLIARNYGREIASRQFERRLQRQAKSLALPLAEAPQIELVGQNLQWTQNLLFNVPPDRAPRVGETMRPMIFEAYCGPRFWLEFQIIRAMEFSVHYRLRSQGQTIHEELIRPEHCTGWAGW